jgi:hypothetical protein
MLLLGWGSNDNGLQPRSVLPDCDAFQHVPMLNAKDMQTVQKLYDARHPDFRLKPGPASVDNSAVIPTVTDGCSSGAPDRGALERRQPHPIMARAIDKYRPKLSRTKIIENQHDQSS